MYVLLLRSRDPGFFFFLFSFFWRPIQFRHAVHFFIGGTLSIRGSPQIGRPADAPVDTLRQLFLGATHGREKGKMLPTRASAPGPFDWTLHRRGRVHVFDALALAIDSPPAVVHIVVRVPSGTRHAQPPVDAVGIVARSGALVNGVDTGFGAVLDALVEKHPFSPCNHADYLRRRRIRCRIPPAGDLRGEGEGGAAGSGAAFARDLAALGGIDLGVERVSARPVARGGRPCGTTEVCLSVVGAAFVAPPSGLALVHGELRELRGTKGGER